MQYYNQPPMMNQGMGMGMGVGMPGMSANAMQGMGMGMGMGMGGMGNYGQAWRHLGYDYTLPSSGYKPEATWGAWDLANAQYNGGRLERSFFDNIISSLTGFFANRHLSEDAARDAHRRVYYQADGADAGNKTLGGAAAYQAYLIWDRDHYSAYHSYPSQDNRERLVGLAVAELFSLWDRVQPRSTRASTEEAAQYAAATAKYLFDRHYDLPHNHHHHRRGSRYSGYSADHDSDSDDERRLRRRSMHGQPTYGPGVQAPMMQGGYAPGMMSPQQVMPMGMGGGIGYGMPGGGMAHPGMGAIGMPGAMGMGNGVMHPMMGMGGLHHPGMGMGMGGMGGMGMMNQMTPGNHGQMGEAQAAPGMHPYTYGTQSGVAWGNQPIDQMGNPTFPGGPTHQGARGWYSYGQPSYFRP
ncbi:hypothetical protein IAU60_003640 [Kwoniella sp. DSM 27419]